MARSYAKTEQVLTTLKPADRDRLDAYAEANEISRAEAVRIFVLNALNDLPDPNAVTIDDVGPAIVDGYVMHSEPVIPR